MIGISTERCPCGRPFPLLKSAEGRSDDILHLPDGAGGSVPVHPMHLRSPLAAAKEVRQYQVVQRKGEPSAGLKVPATGRPFSFSDGCANA